MLCLHQYPHRRRIPKVYWICSRVLHYSRLPPSSVILPSLQQVTDKASSTCSRDPHHSPLLPSPVGLPPLQQAIPRASSTCSKALRLSLRPPRLASRNHDSPPLYLPSTNKISSTCSRARLPNHLFPHSPLPTLPLTQNPISSPSSANRLPNPKQTPVHSRHRFNPCAALPQARSRI